MTNEEIMAELDAGGMSDSKMLKEILLRMISVENTVAEAVGGLKDHPILRMFGGKK